MVIECKKKPEKNQCNLLPSTSGRRLSSCVVRLLYQDNLYIGSKWQNFTKFGHNPECCIYFNKNQPKTKSQN